MTDSINPSHYRSHPSGVECIQITEHMTFNLGNVVKYLWRNGLNDGTPALQDLEKAQWYLSREIERVRAKKPEDYQHAPLPQPETFHAHGHTWFKHTPGDPMPCKPDDIVHFLMKKEWPELASFPEPAGKLRRGDSGTDSDIIGWRYVGKNYVGKVSVTPEKP